MISAARLKTQHSLDHWGESTTLRFLLLPNDSTVYRRGSVIGMDGLPPVASGWPASATGDLGRQEGSNHNSPFTISGAVPNDESYH